jgi:cytochrome c peroxidase
MGIARAGLVSMALAGAVLGAPGCDAGNQFTPEELTTLETFRLGAAQLPSDPSNVYADNSAAAVLGKQFFFEARFGGVLGPYNDGVTNGSLGNQGQTGKIACSSCHQLDTGGGDHRSQPGNVSLGASYTARNAATVMNAAFSPIWQFWDGRKDSAWSQALGPIENPVESNSSRLQVAHVIYDNYRTDYEAIIGPGSMPELGDTTRFPLVGKPGDPAYEQMATDDQGAVDRVFVNFGKIVAAYERRLITPAFAPSPFDLYLAGDESQLGDDAIRGAKLFVGKAGCMECHRGPLFTDYQFHDIGVPQEGDHIASVDDGRLAGISKLMNDQFNLASPFSDAPTSAHLTGLLPSDPDAQADLDGQFKTPTLRNVRKTGPYMHDGVYQDLWEVVNHYNFGGGTGQYTGERSPALQPLLLSDGEMSDLVEFLESLSDGDPAPSSDFPEGLIAPPATP